MRIFALIIGLISSISFAQEIDPSDYASATIVKNSPPKTSQNFGEFSCKSPRDAMRSLTLGENSTSIMCFDPLGRSDTELMLLASRLNKVFKASGVIIDFTKVPDDPEYKDPNSGLQSYKVSSQMPEIYLRKSTQGWQFPKECIDAIDGLYSKTHRLDLNFIYRFVPEWAQDDLLGMQGVNLAQALILSLLILLGLVLRMLVTAVVSLQVGRIFLRLKMHHFESLLRKASLPLGNLAMIALLAMFIPSLGLNVNIVHYLLIATRIAACISAVMLAYRSVDVLAHYLTGRALTTDSKLDDQLVPLFRRGLKITVSAIGGIFILQNLNVDVTSLLAGLTIGGLAFSFAAKDTVANLFGSITIFADKPFSVGDWVKTSSSEGIVEAVGFRSTRIRTFYNSLLSVPNSKFTDSVVDNMGARKYRRSLSTLGIAYNTSPEQIEAFCNGIRAILKAHPKTRKDYYEVHFSGYGDFSLNILLYFFLNVSGYSEELRTKHEIFLDILRLAKKINVTFAFPTQTVHIETLAKEKDISEKPIPSPDNLNEAAKYFSSEGEGTIPPGPRLGPGYFAEK